MRLIRRQTIIDCLVFVRASVSSWYTCQTFHLWIHSLNFSWQDIRENGLRGWFPLHKEDPQLSPNSLSSSTHNLNSSQSNLHHVTSPPVTSSQSHFGSSLLSSQLAQLKSSGASLIHSGGTGPTQQNKQRGELFITAKLKPSADSSIALCSSAKRPYDALLHKVIMHYVHNQHQVSCARHDCSAKQQLLYEA